ncbi:acyl-CoA dehydrogenase family protein [Agromyces larvae]|uniref:Acyl-CoA dehydrogenase family protein n=1 Tax=Agromyces larvae TaxID=2929802 RepID=A0ABY4BVD2_9MICO|nr:acyl-CoA dehydrogenase family protein [Agromyces larvae]UOE43125.1 acyl-CoA dehydrogenase family protein [Agromyces larvae]
MSEVIAASRLATASARLAPVFARIAETAGAHERAATRPYDETQALADAGFGALRVPTELGGGGLTVAEFFAVLVDLGAADSNQPQIWRNHIAFVEDRLAGGTDRDRQWLARIAGGTVIGGAWSETGTASILGETRLERVDGILRLNGVKYYSTGSIYADHVGVLALGDDGAPVIALVASDTPGVELIDDWGGFGQRATGSGTTRLIDVPVADDAVFSFDDRHVSQEAVYQLVLLAALAGVARAVRDDAVQRVIARTRSYPHALAPNPRDDAQVQQVVGRIAGHAAAAEASVERGARAVDEVWRTIGTGGDLQAAARRAAVAVYEAQLTATDAALHASTLVFDALGSSGVQADAALDRHWRNARTLTSHNPRIYKERVIGAYLLNGTDPLSIYTIDQPDAAARVGTSDDDGASDESGVSDEIGASEPTGVSDEPEASA